MPFDEESQRRTLRKAKEIVEECLSEDIRCRNDDLWLILKVWQKKQHINIFIPYERLHEMISAETIRRIRQKIQNEDKKFVPTDDNVIRRRKKKEEFMRSEMLRPTNLVGIDFIEGGDKYGKRKEQ
jgi:hypothetical protein